MLSCESAPNNLDWNLNSADALKSISTRDPYLLVFDAFTTAYRPDPLLTVSEWADRFRVLSNKEAEPGPYRTNRTPYLKEIMDSLSVLSPIVRVIVMKGAQLGFTEVGNNWTGYIIHHAPGRILSVMPTLDIARKHSKSRIANLIEECPQLKNLVRDRRSRDSGNTIFMKEFPGGELNLTGANSAAGLCSTPARFLNLDEVDRYPADCEGEGDPIELAEARARTFERKKIFIFSTPTVKGQSRIEREFEKSDKRYYFVPCPHCGFKQRLEFRREDGSFGLRWRDTSKTKAVYICCECGCEIEDGHKTQMLADGEWIATVESDGKTAGFHISSLYTPVGLGLSWTGIMDLWERSQKDQEKLKSFINTILGETWEEKGDAPEWRRLYERREDYAVGRVPAGGLFLTAGIDVQKDRLEASVWAWGREKESWLIEHRVLDGDTSRPEVWAKLTSFVSETWEHESGVLMSLSRVAIDTGYATSEVYNWVRSLGDSKAIAVKGVDNWDVLLGLAKSVEVNYKGKRIKRGVRVWPVGVSMAKSETYHFLRLKKPTESELEENGYPPGYMHFPKMDEEYFKQLTAESLVTRVKRGFPIREWQKDRERNEALDCRVYARAAAAAYGIDRFSESRWERLEQSLGQKTPTLNPTSTIPPKPVRTVKKRRVKKSSYMQR